MEDNDQSPSLVTLARRIGRAGLGLLQNRSELLLLELQEEKGHAIALLLGAIGFLFAAMVAVLLITGTVILIVPESARAYVAGGFALLYAAATLFAFYMVKCLLKRTPFGQTLAELRKDRIWLESLE